MLKQGDNESRIRYLVRVAAKYIHENPEQTIDYDETTCDGYCLSQELYDQVNTREPQWIDVNDRLPDGHDLHWVVSEGSVSMMEIKPGDTLGAFNICGITHWAEIVKPSPPQEKAND